MTNNLDTESTLKIALPKRGRIADNLGELCKQAGYAWPASSSSRALFAKLSDNVEAMFVRTKDVATVVADGIVDIGITGTDLVEESGSDVSIVEPLDLFTCRLVLAAQPEWHKQYRDNPPKSIRIATSFPNMAKKWGQRTGIEVHIIELSGSVEIAPRIDIADAIVDLTQTGATLRSNGLEEVETIQEVSAAIIGSREFNINDGSTKSIEARAFCDAITAVLNANGKRYVMMNVPKDVLDEVIGIVPGISSPTIIDLYDKSEYVAFHVVVEASELNMVLPVLRSMGVKGILVTHIERLFV